MLDIDNFWPNVRRRGVADSDTMCHAMLRRRHTSVYPYVKPICGYEDLVAVLLCSTEERPFRSGPQATSDPPFFAPCLEGFFA